MYEIVWTGTDESGYVGNVEGVQLYMVQTLACASPPRRKNPERKYLFFPHRRSTGGYGFLDDTQAQESIIRSADEAKALCEADYANGGTAALQEILSSAIAIVRGAGFRVSKPKGFKQKTSKLKDHVGPTFVAIFADGQQTRMSIYTSRTDLDVNRGIRLSRAAYEARARRRFGGSLHPVSPAIVRACFEQDGVVLATYGEQDCNGGAP